MNTNDVSAGRLVRAPEGFLGPEGIRTVFSQAKAGRRDFIRGALAAAATTATSLAAAQSNPVPSTGGDPNILNLPEHSKGLGQGVATDGYGKPSRFESNL